MTIPETFEKIKNDIVNWVTLNLKNKSDKDHTHSLSSLGINVSADDINKLNQTTTNLQNGINSLNQTTNSLQQQVNSKQPAITGAATSITGNNLTANRALISDGNGKVSVSDVTSSQLSQLSGVTGNVQDQLNKKPNVSMTLVGTTLYITST